MGTTQPEPDERPRPSVYIDGRAGIPYNSRSCILVVLDAGLRENPLGDAKRVFLFMPHVVLIQSADAEVCFRSPAR